MDIFEMKKAMEDMFAPSIERNGLGQCLHCGEIYKETELIWENRFGYGSRIWWCRTEECDGAGVGHDLMLLPEPDVYEEPDVQSK